MKPKRRSKLNPNLSRRNNSEKNISRFLLNGFVSKGSRGEKIIEEITGRPLNKISRTGLIQIANIFSELLDIKLERNFKRKKDLLVKWFEQNEEYIMPFKNHMILVFENENQNANKKQKIKTKKEKDKKEDIIITNN